MLLRSSGPYRRTSRFYRHSRVRLIPVFILLVALYDLYSTWLAPPVYRVTIPNSTLDSSSPSPSISNSVVITQIPQQQQRVFIASIQWNAEPFLRQHWNTALLKLVRHFGPQNVYVSILEGGSWDNTRAALSQLDVDLERLGVERSIVYEDRTHEDEVKRTPAPGEEGWVWTSRGMKELRRIPFMAGLRNRVMGVMRGLAMREGERKRVFDKVLWLNDVIFTTEDVETLLNTRNGDYAAVCSLDFSEPPLYHDTFPLRDINGHEPVSRSWPYFSSYLSRHALYQNQAIPVQSCWNGMVFFAAKPFYDNENLNFRGIPDSLASDMLEGSEACLIHVDNKYSREKGVWVNPNVRVAYTEEVYKKVNPDNGRKNWPYDGGWDRVQAIWGNRKDRVMQWGDRYMQRYMIQQKVKTWEHTAGSANGGVVVGEVGTACLVNEMQVLIAKGWANV